MKTTLFASMKKSVVTSLSVLLVASAFAAAPDDYNVVWDSPSQDHHGSMPLGNGDIALNAWMPKDGDLQFYISKTDAWDDNARSVKVGKVRVHLEPNPFAGAKAFRQEFKLREGCVEIVAGTPDASSPSTIRSPQATVRLWVDANDPVVYVTTESATPIEATAIVEVWRTNRSEVAEVQCSDVLNHPGRPQSKHGPTFVEPDTVLPQQGNRVGWFHHNIKSVGRSCWHRCRGSPASTSPTRCCTARLAAWSPPWGASASMICACVRRAARRIASACSYSRAIPRPRSNGGRTWTPPSSVSRGGISPHAARLTPNGGTVSGIAVGFAHRPIPMPDPLSRPWFRPTRMMFTSGRTRGAGTDLRASLGA